MKTHLHLGITLGLLCLNVAAAAEFYLSPQGSDSAAGDKANPFATLEKAREAVREARKKNPAESCTVWLGGGDYFLKKPFELGTEDSGTVAAPVVWRAAEGQTPRLLVSRKMAATDFKSVTDPATTGRIAKEAEGKIVALDLKALGVQHAKTYPDVFGGNGNLLDLFINGKRQPLSRFPNKGYMTMKQVLANGSPKNGDPGIFEYREEFYEAHARWAKALEHGVWLKGYWRIPWQNEAIRIASIDTNQHSVTFAKGVGAGGIGNKYVKPIDGVRPGNGKEAYWLFNLLEEIDQPGEWCVDFKDQKLYLYPASPLEQAEILLADTSEPVVLLREVSHVTVRGLTIEANLGDGLQVKGGERNLIAGCTLRNLDNYGVRIEGGKNHVVRSNDISNLGCGGVWLGGGDEKATPRVPAGHQCINNHIWNFSQIERIYTPGVNCGYTGGTAPSRSPSVGMLVAHNLIHDTPHAGVLFGGWDSIFEYNEVFRYATVSNDIGAFYSYDQYERDGGHTFRYNFMHDSLDGDGIYWDCDHRDMKVYGNITYLKNGTGRGTGYLYKIGSQPKNPQRIDCWNNIAIQSNVGFQFVNVLPNPGKIENNVSILSQKTAYVWREVPVGGKEIKAEPYGTGSNIEYPNDPGFVDMEKYDFRLKPDAQLKKDLPGFEPIPVEKIGLFVDEYRKKLPTSEEIDRFNTRTQSEDLGYEILDRGR